MQQSKVSVKYSEENFVFEQVSYSLFFEWEVKRVWCGWALS